MGFYMSNSSLSAPILSMVAALSMSVSCIKKENKNLQDSNAKSASDSGPLGQCTGTSPQDPTGEYTLKFQSKEAECNEENPDAGGIPKGLAGTFVFRWQSETKNKQTVANDSALLSFFTANKSKLEQWKTISDADVAEIKSGILEAIKASGVTLLEKAGFKTTAGLQYLAPGSNPKHGDPSKPVIVILKDASNIDFNVAKLKFDTSAVSISIENLSIDATDSAVLLLDLVAEGVKGSWNGNPAKLKSDPRFSALLGAMNQLLPLDLENNTKSLIFINNKDGATSQNGIVFDFSNQTEKANLVIKAGGFVWGTKDAIWSLGTRNTYVPLAMKPADANSDWKVDVEDIEAAGGSARR